MRNLKKTKVRERERERGRENLASRSGFFFLWLGFSDLDLMMICDLSRFLFVLGAGGGI